MRALLIRGAAGSAVLVVGGYFYARLPKGTWMDRMRVLWSVRHSSHHLAWGLVLSTIGLVLLTWAWWDLRRRVKSGSTGLSGVRRATAVWSVPLLLGPPVFSGDGWSYVATGVLTAQGRSPYLWTPDSLPLALRSGVSPEWQSTPSPYGPLALSWGGAFAHLFRDPWFLLTAYRLAAVLGVVLLAWAVPVLARRVGRDPVDASLLAVASPFVLVHGIGGLHNDVETAALAVAALAVTRPGRWLLGAVLVGLAAAVKAPGLVAAIGVVLLSLEAGARWYTRLGRSALVGGVAGGTLLGTGWITGLGTGWIGALSVPDHEYTVLSLSAVGGRIVRSFLHHSGPAGVRLIHQVHPAIFAKRLGVVVLLLVAAWVLLRTRVGSPRRAIAAAGVVALAAVLLSPIVHYWYFLWCVPVLACVPLRRPLGMALVAGVTALGLTAVADHALRIRWLWETGAWSLVLAPVLAWALTQVREQRRPPAAPPGAPPGAPTDTPATDAPTDAAA